MEFPFDINNLFPERISFLDQTLVSGDTWTGRPHLQSKIASVIDELGKASSMAQQLPAPITSALKLQSNPHCLYLIKEEASNGGHGAGVGFLKVGYKKLFLLDQRGAHVEAEPLCVLDFYIAESLQRHGYGLELFDFMLQHKQVEPSLLAYDRPSAKFLSFLAKHYCLNQSVPQVNNFVVFDGFFRNKSVGQSRKALPKKPDGEIKPYSLMAREVCEERRATPWPFSPPVSGSSLYSRSHSVGSSPSRAPPTPATPQGPAHAPGGHRGPQTAHSPLSDSCKARRTRPSPRSLPPLRMPMENQLPSLRLPPVIGSSKRPDRVTWDRDAKTELLPVRQGPPLAPWGGGASLGLHTAQWVRHKQEFRSTRPW